MKNKPKVSVVMSVYNDSRYLREAIKSILNQTFSNFEFIIIDDGSTDGSGQILDEYALKDRRIKVIHQENIGLTRALNKGIKLAKGEYIARMDADDISLPNRLEKEVDYLDKHREIGLVACFAKVIDEQKNVIGEHRPPTEHNLIKRRMFFAGQICHPSTMFRKSIFEELGGYNEQFRYAQDYELWLRMMRKFKVANIPEFLFFWRKSEKGIGISKKNDQKKFAQKARLMAIKSGLYPPFYFLFLIIFYFQFFLENLLTLKWKKTSSKKQKTNFSFGRNWVDYVINFLTEKEIGIAYDSLFKYLPKEKYKDKTFIDVGCGSGIFSLSALKLGCRKVISFDVDESSIKATEIVKNKFSKFISANSQWEIFKGDILNENLVNQLKNQGDIVYSWGTLHHTGNMYQAIQNVASIVKDGGYLILAIYNRTGSSNFWLKVKKFYNKTSVFNKKIMVYTLFFYVISRKLYGIFKRKISNQKRGMSIFYDVIDWLGGYPYEYATFGEIKDFLEDLGFKLIKAPVKLPAEKKRFLSYTGNNEFVFQKFLK